MYGQLLRRLEQFHTATGHAEFNVGIWELKQSWHALMICANIALYRKRVTQEMHHKSDLFLELITAKLKKVFISIEI